LILETPNSFDFHRPRRNAYAETSCCVKEMLSGPTDAVRNIVRRVSFAITGMQVNSSRGELLTLSVRHSNLQRPSGVKIHLSMNLVCVRHSVRLGRHSPDRAGAQGNTSVRDKNDLLAIGRPSGFDVRIDPSKI